MFLACMRDSSPPPPTHTHICTQLRLRNYVKPNRKGEVKASENVLKMFKTDKGSI